MFLSKRTLYNMAFLAAFVLGLFQVSGQQVQRYTGPYNVGQYSGQANFNYRIVAGDTILQGPFQMQRSNLGALVDDSDAFFGFLGSFENGYPNGYWKLQFGEFSSGSTSELVGFQYRVNVSGVQLEASGDIQKGRPDGEWTISRERIENSEVHETLFKSTFILNSGVPQQSFRIDNDSLTLIGRFLRNGLAHDAWTCFATDSEDSETWNFEEGVLKRIDIDNEGDTQSFSFSMPSGQSTKTISLNKAYFKIIEQQLGKKGNTASSLHSLMATNADYYAKIDTILNGLGTADFSIGAKVKVPFYPLDSVQRKMAKQFGEWIQIATDKSGELLRNSHLNLVRRSDAEVHYLLSVLEVFSEEYIEALRMIADYEASGVLEYVDRETLFTTLFADGRPNIIIQPIAGDTRTFSGPRADSFNFEGDFWEAVPQMAEYTFLSVESIASKLQSKVSNLEEQEEVLELENRMIQLTDSLKNQFDKTATGLSPKMKNALQQLSILAENRVNQFSNLDSSTNKLESARAVVVCLQNIKVLSSKILQLPERSEKIKETYVDDVWNPFMATIMKEEVKKRITQAYENVLVPYALSTIAPEMDCENTEKISGFLDEAFDKVLELRDKDTSKLERKLRREKNPKTVIAHLGLNPLENN